MVEGRGRHSGMSSEGVATDLADREVIAIVASSLQRATFMASRHANRRAYLIGNRGIPGDVTYNRSVLNDHRFLGELDRLIPARNVEVFLPNSLNALFFYCLAHPRVSRISFVDEGRLTKNFLNGDFARPPVPLTRFFAAAFRLGQILPSGLRSIVYKLATLAVLRIVRDRYVSDTSGFPYRTLERHWKGGVILSHIACETPVDDVEFVDVTQDVELEHDLEGAASLFIHPNNVADDKQIRQLCDLIASQAGYFERGVICPHPLFSLSRERLDVFHAALSRSGKIWDIISLDGRYETAVELFSRGVRVFILSDTSILDTVAAFPDFFAGLRIVRIQAGAPASENGRSTTSRTDPTEGSAA